MKRLSFFRNCIFIALSFSFVFCLGRGDEPERTKDADDSLPGRFAREIGPGELDILLNNPEDQHASS